MVHNKRDPWPMRCKPSNLARVGVEIPPADVFKLRCKACGREWSPTVPGRSTELNRGYWRCPNGCNADRAA